MAVRIVLVIEQTEERIHQGKPPQVVEVRDYTWLAKLTLPIAGRKSRKSEIGDAPKEGDFLIEMCEDIRKDMYTHMPRLGRAPTQATGYVDLTITPSTEAKARASLTDDDVRP